ncbi:MAG: hypothetical protein PUE50_01890 [Firmicutes bacterium]|nr:hypothetical protein [Bacillota bacterium]MDD6978937.1 hypothetical protein [Bacillota bacterium]MDY5606814.1 hypothetical protein [Lentihominibacter sp.]MDY6173685.1 hypothetical protein [Lentihominibacter sp.]
MEKKSTLICNKCGVPLEPIKVNFSYLGKQFEHEVDRCPECGQVYIPEELAKGRMAEVEKILEDK